jgi:hypothetical protein
MLELICGLSFRVSYAQLPGGAIYAAGSFCTGASLARGSIFSQQEQLCCCEHLLATYSLLML